MASRKRVMTPRILKVIDTADINSTKALGIAWLLKEQLEHHLEGEDARKDVDSVMQVLIDLLHEIEKAADDLSNEQEIYADTLDEYLAVQKAEFEMGSIEITKVN